MFDWNGDGKHDLRDDVFFLSETEKKESDKIDDIRKSHSVKYKKDVKPQESNKKPKFEITGSGFVVFIVGIILFLTVLFKIFPA